jgi:ATP-dependent protease ClpP protease subunit
MSNKTNLSEYNVAVGRSTSASEYHFNLMGGVEEADHYTDLLNTLRNAEEEDTVHIHINSYGGYVGTAVQIVNWIEQSKATVIGHLESICHSAATVIFLSCDNWVVYDNCLALFHQYSAGFYGEGHKVKSQVVATDAWISNLNEKYYKNFLSDEEIADMSEGKDFWFNSTDIEERLGRYIEARHKKVEEAQEQQEAATIEQAKMILSKLDDKGKENDSRSNEKAKECTC